MSRQFVIFFIIFLLRVPAWADERSPNAGELPDVQGPPPKEKPIHIQTTEEGEEQSYAMASTYRTETLYPSNWGEVGIFRVRSAESLPEGALTFGVGGEFYSISDSPVLGFGSSSAQTIAESLFVGYSPVKQLTLAVMRRSSSTTLGQPQQLISSLGDFNFSALYSFPLNESMAVAPITDLLVASNFNNLAPSGNTVSFGLGGAFTYTLYPRTGVPLYLHANAIYHTSQIRGTTLPGIQPETFFNFSRYNTLTLGLGAEYKIGDFIPFLEFYDTVETSSNLSFGQNPSKLSLGSRFTPLNNKSLALLVGADIGMGRGLVTGVPFSPSYAILGQISYTVGVTNTERKHYFTTADVSVVDRKFVIRKNVNFKIASAELEPDSTKLLDQIGQVIQENKVHKLMVIGHTDSSHNEDYNLKLSLDRANAVKSYLVSKGIADETLITQGYGKRRPKASNATESGRALNRRVEFYIID